MNEIYTMHSLHGDSHAEPEIMEAETVPVMRVTGAPTVRPAHSMEHWFIPAPDGGCWDIHMQPAQAYVLPQRLQGVLPPEEGLRKGTIFPILHQPYRRRGDS